MDNLSRPPIDWTHSKSLRQFFQALNFRMLQETALALGILAVMLSLLVPVQNLDTLLEAFIQTVAPPTVALLIAYAVGIHSVCTPVRQGCERLLGAHLLEPEEQAAVIGQTAALPQRLFGGGLAFWILGWSAVAAWTLRRHGLEIALPTAVGGLLAAITTHLLSYFRNKRAFLPIAESLAERTGIELPAERRLHDEFRRQLSRVLVLLSCSVVLLASTALFLQARQIQQLAPELFPSDTAWRYAFRSALALAAFGLGFPMLLAGFVSRELRVSAERLAESGNRIASGDLRRAVQTVSTQELASIERSLRRIAGGIRTSVGNFRGSVHALEGSVQEATAPAARLVSESQSLSEDLEESAAEWRRTRNGLDSAVTELGLIQERLEAHALASRELDALAESLAPGLSSLAASVTQLDEQLLQTTQTADAQDQRLDGLVELSGTSTRNVAELAGLVLKVRRHAEESARVSGRVQQSAESGAASLRSRLEGLTSIQETISWASQSIGALGERSQEIGEILGVITSIAKQTNMLSLNAAIIASQAGEHGAGFNIIADEIRSLAEKTSAYTKMVEELVGTIVQGTDKAIEAMMVCFDRLSSEMEASHATEQMLETIARGASESQDLGRSILGVTAQEIEVSTRTRLAADELDKGVGAAARGLKDTLSQLRGLAETFSINAGMLKTMSPTVAHQRRRSAGLTAEFAETRQVTRRSARELEHKALSLEQGAQRLDVCNQRCQQLRAFVAELGSHLDAVHLHSGRLAEGLEAFRLP